MNIIEVLAKEFGLKQSQVEQTVNLIDEGNTIPFIARYRKEATGGLSDVVLRDLDERLTYLRNLEERKEEVIRLIEEQNWRKRSARLKFCSAWKTFINHTKRRRRPVPPRPEKRGWRLWRRSFGRRRKSPEARWMLQRILQTRTKAWSRRRKLCREHAISSRSVFPMIRN